MLYVTESAEPSNILWSNLEISKCDRYIGRIAELTLTIAVLVASYFLIQYCIVNYLSLVPLVIAWVCML